MLYIERKGDWHARDCGYGRIIRSDSNRIIAGILFNQRALDRLESRVDARFVQIESRLGQMEVRLSKVEAVVESLKIRLDQMASQIQHLESRIDRIDADLQQFFRTQGMLEKAVEVLEKRN